MEFRFSTRVNNRTPVFPLQLIYKTIWRNKLVRYVHAGSIRFCFKITVHRRRYIFRISFFVIPSLLFQRRRNTILFYSTINRFESNRFDVSLDCPRKRLRDITNLLLSHRAITFWLEKVYEKSLHKHSLPRFSFQFPIPISRDDIDSSLENSIPPPSPEFNFPRRDRNRRQTKQKLHSFEGIEAHETRRVYERGNRMDFPVVELTSFDGRQREAGGGVTKQRYTRGKGGRWKGGEDTIHGAWVW